MSQTQDFQDCAEAKFRRDVRSMIRRGPFTSAEREVVLAFVNHWLHHRKRSEVIHPGRTKLAKKAKTSVATVKRCLSVLREYEVIDAVAHLDGLRGNATEYTVNIARLSLLCGLKKTDRRVNGGSNDPTCGRVKMTHRLSDVIDLRSHREKLAGGRNA